MHNTEQQFLKALDDKLWKAADKLRAKPGRRQLQARSSWAYLSQVRV